MSLLALVLLQSPLLSPATEVEALETEWLVPTLHISKQYPRVSRVTLKVDVASEDEATRPARLFLTTGASEFNLLGEPRNPGKTVELAVSLQIVDEVDRGLFAGGRTSGKQKRRTLYTVLAEDASQPLFRVVIAKHHAVRSRIVPLRDQERDLGVLSLRSSRFVKELAEHGPMRLEAFDVYTRSFLGPGDSPSQISITGAAPGRVQLTNNPNHKSRNGFGDIGFTTAVGYFPIEYQSKVQQSGKGSGNRLIALRRPDSQSLASPQPWPGERASEPVRQYFVALDELLAGRHRLVIRESGKVERIERLHSTRLWRALRIQSQVTDPREVKLTAPNSTFLRHLDSF